MKIQKEEQWGSLTNQGRLHRGSDPGAEAGGRRNSSGGKEAWDTEGAESHFPMLILLTLTASITPTPTNKLSIKAGQGQQGRCNPWGGLARVI